MIKKTVVIVVCSLMQLFVGLSASAAESSGEGISAASLESVKTAVEGDLQTIGKEQAKAFSALYESGKKYNGKLNPGKTESNLKTYLTSMPFNSSYDEITVYPGLDGIIKNSQALAKDIQAYQLEMIIKVLSESDLLPDLFKESLSKFKNSFSTKFKTLFEVGHDKKPFDVLAEALASANKGAAESATEKAADKALEELCGCDGITTFTAIALEAFKTEVVKTCNRKLAVAKAQWQAHASIKTECSDRQSKVSDILTQRENKKKAAINEALSLSPNAFDFQFNLGYVSTSVKTLWTNGNPLVSLGLYRTFSSDAHKEKMLTSEEKREPLNKIKLNLAAIINSLDEKSTNEIRISLEEIKELLETRHSQKETEELIDRLKAPLAASLSKNDMKAKIKEIENILKEVKDSFKEPDYGWNTYGMHLATQIKLTDAAEQTVPITPGGAAKIGTDRALDFEVLSLFPLHAGRVNMYGSGRDYFFGPTALWGARKVSGTTNNKALTRHYFGLRGIVGPDSYTDIMVGKSKGVAGTRLLIRGKMPFNIPNTDQIIYLGLEGNLALKNRNNNSSADTIRGFVSWDIDNIFDAFGKKSEED